MKTYEVTVPVIAYLKIVVDRCKTPETAFRKAIRELKSNGGVVAGHDSWAAVDFVKAHICKENSCDAREVT